MSSVSVMPYVERLVPGNWAWDLDICAHAQRYRFASQFVRGKRVLDAGCGVGYGSRILAYFGACEVVGLDISEEALDTARKQFTHSRVKFLQDDCEHLRNVKGPFDVIVCLENLEHLNCPERFLSRAAENLCPDGMLICSTPQSLRVSGKPDNPYHVKEYSLGEFQELLEPYFGDIVICGQDVTATAKAVHVLWSNPLVRLGRLLQALWGRKVQTPGTAGLRFTESDFVISEFNVQTARVLIAICTGRPRR
jgi:SAM-dependent methyltransferase